MHIVDRFTLLKKISKYIKSKFYLDTPLVASNAEWEAWDTNAKKNHRFLYFLNQTIPFNYKKISHIFHNVIYWILNRTIDRYHVHLFQSTC
jgi:hypothetical protein